MNTPIRAVLYARVSTEDQARHGTSLQSQAEECRAYAESNGWLVVGDISDDGISGTTLDRPGLDEVRRMASVQEFDVLVVYDLDRLSRRVVHQQIVELELEKASVRIEYVNGGFADGDEGNLQKTIRAAIAEYEVAKIAERNTRGRRTKARNNKVVGSGTSPYGYTYRDGAFHINESEAEVVRLIFELCRQGTSGNAIARELGSRGFITRMGRRKWAPNTVITMLRNETYAGTWYYAKFERCKDGKRRRRDRDKWIAVNVPAIIDRSDWECVQAKLDRNRDRYRRLPRHAYLLRGLLWCPVCTRAYVGGASGKYLYYRDGGRQHRALRAEVAETAVWDAVQRILSDDGNLMQGWEETRESASQEREVIHTQLGSAEQQRGKALAKMDNLTASYVDPDIDMGKAEYMRLRADIQREIDRYSEKREKLRRRLTADAITEAHARTREAFVAQIRGRLLDADFDTKREVLEALQVTGDVTWAEDGRAEITLSGLFPHIAVGLSSRTSERS